MPLDFRNHKALSEMTRDEKLTLYVQCQEDIEENLRLMKSITDIL